MRVPAGPAVALDAVLVIGFAALGRSSHDEGITATGVLEVAAPFLIAAGLGWVLARGWRDPAGLGTGLVVWGTALVGGMLLRGTVFDRGTAAAFVGVAALSLGALLLGWRLAARAVRPGARIGPGTPARPD